MRIGILGDSNTGKSFMWAYYRRPEEVFSISPTNKVEMLGHIGNPKFKISELNISFKGKSQDETIEHFAPFIKQQMNTTVVGLPHLISFLTIPSVSKHYVPGGEKSEEISVTGDWQMVQVLANVEPMKKFVSLYMPKKRIILTHDFGHYINYYMQDPEFRNRRSGNQAFERFWDLAADSVKHVFFSPNIMRSDMIDIAEFHIQIDSEMEKYDIFTPGGKMLQEKFKGKSYFDIALFTRVLPWEEMKDPKKRYKLVAVQKEYFDGRDLGLLYDLMDANGEITNTMITEIMDRVIAYVDRRNA